MLLYFQLEIGGFPLTTGIDILVKQIDFINELDLSAAHCNLSTVHIKLESLDIVLLHTVCLKNCT